MKYSSFTNVTVSIVLVLFVAVLSSQIVAAQSITWKVKEDLRKQNDRFRAADLGPEGNLYLAADGLRNSVIKYSPEGKKLLQAYYGFKTQDIAVDDEGQIYLVGHSGNRFITGKLDQKGNILWTASEKPGVRNRARGVGVDSDGNVYTTGQTGYNFATYKYNSEGKRQWERIVKSSVFYDGGRDLAVGDNHVYVAGEYQDDGYRTLKYDFDGTEVWRRDFNGPGHDRGHSITLDSSENLYVAGKSLSREDNRYRVIKYDPSGNQLWNTVRKTDSSGDMPRGIAVGNGKVYVNGSRRFDTRNDRDLLTMVFDANDGSFLSEINYNEGNEDNGFGVAVEPGGAFYLTGRASGDALILKYGSCSSAEFMVRPKRVNINGGKLTVFLTGLENGDPEALNPSSVTLNGASPTKWQSTPRFVKFKFNRDQLGLGSKKKSRGKPKWENSEVTLKGDLQGGGCIEAKKTIKTRS